MAKFDNDIKKIVSAIKNNKVSPENGLQYLKDIKKRTAVGKRIKYYKPEWSIQKISDECLAKGQYQIFVVNNRNDFLDLDVELKKSCFIVNNLYEAEAIVFIAGDNETFDDGMKDSVYSLFPLIKDITRIKTSKLKKFIYIYENSSQKSFLANEAALGFFSSLNLLIPDAVFTSVQLDFKVSETSDIVNIINDELNVENERKTTEIKYCNNIREIKRLSEMKDYTSVNDIYKENGVYIISGGMGSLGRKYASFLSQNYKARVILFGRTVYTNNQISELLEGMNTSKIEYYSVNVCDLSSVKKMIETVIERYGYINGIIHIAGGGPKEIISDKSLDDFNKTINAKIEGAFNLDEATKGINLDFFMTFSSLSAFFGDFGQCDYAISNRFLTAFSKYRDDKVKNKLRFGRNICVCWPLWENGGMHGNHDAEVLYKNLSGLEDISDAEGDYLFENLPLVSCLLIIKGDRQKYKKTINYSIADNNTKNIKTNNSSNKDQKEYVLESLREIVSNIILMRPEDINNEENISVYGFESLDLKSFAEAINKKWNLGITPTIFFEKSTISQLTEYLIGKYKILSDNDNEKKEKVIAIKSEKSYISNYNLNKKKKYAIIGLDGIFPKSSDAHEFWERIVNEENLITEVPIERWDYRKYYSEKIVPHKTNSKWGGFAPDIDKFDEQFFKISPYEAEIMDPQQRLCIQSVWKAIEDAGYEASSWAGKDVGVFFGAEFMDYQNLINICGEVNAQVARGNAHTMISNRVSFIFDFNGPSEVIDTACSASLVAVKRAVDAMVLGECSIAVVGGVSLNISPYNYVAASQMGMLSKDGRCKTFDKTANGFVKSEGVGVIIIKDYDAAVKDGDNIYATIIGTAENHGGRANSLTSPNKKMQSDLIEKAYKDADIDVETVSYIETHGTGTELGDPIEVDALKDAFENLRKNKNISKPVNYCGLGAIKSNIGHLEAASGIVGLIKVLLSFRHKKLTKVLFNEQNPYIQLENSPFYIIKETKEWDNLKDSSGKIIPRRAGVSAFGFGGSNAHIVLEESVDDNRIKAKQYPRIFVLSAKDENQLRLYVSNYQKFIDNNFAYIKENWQSVLYTLQVGREQMDARLAICAADAEELLYSLRQLANDWRNTDKIFVEKDRNISDNEFEPSLASKWVNGININWQEYWDVKGIRRISLPTYPFKRNSHWIKAFKEIVNDIFNTNDAKAERSNISFNEVRNDDIIEEGNLLYRHKWEKCTSYTGKSRINGKYGVVISNDLTDILFDKLRAEMDLDLVKIRLNDLNVEKSKELIANNNDMAGVIVLSDLSNISDTNTCIDSRLLYFLQQIIISLRNISLIHLTSNACAYKSDNVTMNGVLTAGLFRMLSKEYKNINAITVDIEDLKYESVIYGIEKGFEHIALNQICIRDKQVYKQYFCRETTVSHNKCPISKDKVYVIAGGTSGVGLELAESLLKQGAKKLVLMGVHNIPNILEWGNIENKNYDDKTVSKVKKYLKLIESGAELHFYIGEISDKAKMTDYFTRIKNEVGRISGVIQSAWYPFSDTPFFINKSIEQIEEVIKPKTIGTAILSEVVKDEPLDFFVMCSSMASAIPEMGVGNCHYSMANYYLDCFSEYMQSKGHKAYKTINWIFWGETGAANSAENIQRMKKIGIYTINNKEGVSCFYNVLNSEGCRFMAGRIDEDRYCDVIDNEKNKMNDINKFHESQLYKFEQLKNVQIMVDEYIVLRIMKLFQKYGYFDEVAKEYSLNKMITDMHIIDKYHSLFAAMLSILHEHDLVRLKNNNETVICINSSVDEDKLTYLGKELYNADNEYKDIYSLLKECLDNIDDILQDKEQATRIIFPNGSMSKVEAIYSKGDIIGHLNTLMAKYIFEITNKILKNNSKDKVRILEVGAGTGGTSRYILKELAEKSDRIEYCYTDVSNAFLIFAKNKFEKYDFVDYKIFNVNDDLASQGFSESSFDIICATNVIHATKNINKTLKKLNTLLRKDGVIIVSEMMSVQNFATCIFGLLDDWWNYEDRTVRLAHSPLLSRRAWEEQYHKAGFETIDFYGVKNATNNDNAQGVLCGRKVENAAFESVNAPMIKAEGIINVNYKENNMDKIYIIEKISDFLSELLHINRSEINSEAPLETYGIDSILVQMIILGLEEKFNFSINPALVLENKNISQMAQYMLDNYKNELASILPKINTAAIVEDKKEHIDNNAIDSNDDDYKKVAIIGMAGTFPGANNIDEFWENIKNGICSIREVPESRWSIEKYYSTQMTAGKTVSKWGGFLNDITSFDAQYFNFAEEDAVHVDPLARKFLEVSAQAVNHAGYKREELNGKRVGVFAAGRVADYANAVGDYRKNSIVGLGQNFIAANVSRNFNIHGSSMVIDTACSSSLVSIHEACKSIISGESQMAIAGGVEILLNVRPFLILSQMGAFSPNGVCSPFDEKANGFVPGEGCGVIILKSMKDAKKDGDKIYAVIDGSAVNCDGNTMGMTTPNPHMQKQVILDALAQNNTDASTYTYIEAHGTGTQIGDSIELKGLTEVLREYTDDVGYCVVGSVKANIGHLFLASGVAGLIKCVLCINNKKLVPLINCDKPNPRYKFDDSPLLINHDFIDWTPKCGIRRAGISSFGLGGTNAHVIVSEFTDTHYCSKRSPLSDIKFNKKHMWYNETGNTIKNGTNRRMLKLIKE